MLPTTEHSNPERSDLPGPPTCSVCGTADAPRYVGGYGYHVREDCLVATELAE